MPMEFTIEELLDEEVCSWCAKKKCPLRSKVANLTHCKDLKFDTAKREKHDAFNAARMKISLIHALCHGGSNNWDEESFRNWAKQTYTGKPISP